jgi:cytochrome c biogenesis protein CcdA
MDPNYTKFSDTLTASFTNLYRVGGLVLVFIFIGVITMSFGNLYNSALSKWIFGVGAIITLCCLGLFLYGQLRGPVQAARLRRDNKETLDAMQGIALLSFYGACTGSS